MKNIDNKNQGIYVLAEIAQSYEGDKNVFLQIIDGLAKAKTDGAMFQVVYAEELAVSDYDYFELFQNLEMSDHDWADIVNAIQVENLAAIAEVFGKQSFDMMINLGIDGIKIHVSDITNEPFLEYVGHHDIPVLLGVGGASSEEIKKAVSLLNTKPKDLTLMHGYQKGPTPISDTHFHKIKALIDQYQLPVGYSDHIAGSEDGNIKVLNSFAMHFPLVAIGAGAVLIEKHVMLDRTKEWEDCESALSVSEFGYFVECIRQVSASLGTLNLERNETEMNYRSAIKGIVARRDIASGTLVTEADIAFKRSNETAGLIKNIEFVVGRITKQSIKANSAITKEMLKLG